MRGSGWPISPSRPDALAESEAMQRRALERLSTPLDAPEALQLRPISPSRSGIRTALDDARGLYEALLADARRVLGEDAPLTTQVVANLAALGLLVEITAASPLASAMRCGCVALSAKSAAQRRLVHEAALFSRTRGVDLALWRLLSHMASPTSAVAWLAARQHGVITAAQLLDCGLSRAQIATKLRRCELHRLHHGVFAVGHTALPEFGLEHAAVLACGEGTVLSHASAAWMWRLIRRPGGPVHVTVLGRTLRCRPGLRIHRSDTLPPADIRTREAMPLTSPARTLIDLAAGRTQDAFEAALSEARFLRLIRDGELERALERSRSRPGTKAVRAHLNREAGPQITQSQAERLFLRLVRQAGLPPPRTQQRIEGFRVDAVWPAERLVVELDGIQGHGHRSAFERDRRRDAILIAHGWRVIHFTWPQLDGQPLYVIATLSAALTTR